MTVWKFPLALEDAPVIEMPRGARLLHIAKQHDFPVVWALVDPTAPRVGRCLRLMGTGHDLLGPPDAPHVGTITLRDGLLVYHVFDFGEITDEHYERYKEGENLLDVPGLYGRGAE
jgi:hypothetical protein